MARGYGQCDENENGSHVGLLPGKNVSRRTRAGRQGCGAEEAVLQAIQVPSTIERPQTEMMVPGYKHETNLVDYYTPQAHILKNLQFISTRTRFRLSILRHALPCSQYFLRNPYSLFLKKPANTGSRIASPWRSDSQLKPIPASPVCEA